MTTIAVENIRCGGCVASIIDRLEKKHQLMHVAVDIEKGLVQINEVANTKRLAIVKTLLHLGYPEVGSTQGWNKTKTKAKSVLSCAIGKIKQK